MLGMLRPDVRAEDQSNSARNGTAAAPTRDRFFLFYALLCAGLVQMPTLGHFFRGDDFVHLYGIADHDYLRFAFATHGGHLLFTSKSVFYLMYSLFGLESNAYYGLAILSHLVNVFLLYRVVEISTSRSGLALVASLLWGMSAVNQGSLGWYSVYGHVLVGNFLLWILYDMARIRYEGIELGNLKLLRWYLLLLAAATSFGTGIPVAMLGGLVAWLLLPEGAARRRATISLGSLAVLVPALYFSWVSSSADLLGDAAAVSHLESNLAFYTLPSHWLSALTLWVRMVAYGFSSLLLGPMPIAAPAFASTGVLAKAPQAFVTPLSLGLGGIAVLGVFVAMGRATLAERRSLCAYGVWMLSVYAVIAVGRSAFLDQIAVSPSSFAMQPRYYYVAPALGVILVALSATHFPRLLGRTARVATVLLLSAIAVMDYSAARWLNRYELPSDAGVAYGDVVAEIEKRIHSKSPGDRVEIVNRAFPVIGLMNEESFPGWAAVYVLHFAGNEVEGRRVVFVERKRERLRAIRLRGGERLNSLVESPAQTRENRTMRGGRASPPPRAP